MTIEQGRGLDIIAGEAGPQNRQNIPVEQDCGIINAGKVGLRNKQHMPVDQDR